MYGVCGESRDSDVLASSFRVDRYKIYIFREMLVILRTMTIFSFERVTGEYSSRWLQISAYMFDLHTRQGSIDDREYSATHRPMKTR